MTMSIRTPPHAVAPALTPAGPLPFVVRRDGRAMDALYEAGKIMASPLDPNRMLSMVLNVLSSFTELRCGAVAMAVAPEDRLDDATVNPYVIAATTLSDRVAPPGCGAMPAMVARTVFSTGVALTVQNAAEELGADVVPRPLRDAGPVALLAAPIREAALSPLVTGVVCVWRVLEDGDPVSLAQDARLLRMIANLMAQSLRFHALVQRDRERLIEAAQSRDPAADDRPIDDIVGESAAMRDVAARIRKVAPTRATVLLRGESGTGKELFARAIHTLSTRSHKAFVKVNCAALSETLLESELFGHEKGAFTGAQTQKKGRFEMADGGTLFLDEIGEISPAFQAKLLRALQEGEFERVGGVKTVGVDVRIIAATNRDLEDAVAKGDFRADLYFRICVIPIVLPSLRERPDDIPRLAESFLERFNADNGARLRFAPDAVAALRACYFPGNVRELENCVQRVAALSSGPVIAQRDLACANDACMSAHLGRLRAADASPVGGLAVANAPAPARVVLPVLNPAPGAPPCVGGPAARAPSERERLVDAMERAGWVQAKAARLLGLTPRQIGYALRKHDVDVQKF